MFERFTKEAQAVVGNAHQIARETGSRAIDSRHLLVALAEEPGSVRRALQGSGVDAATVASKARDALSTDGLDAAALATLGIDLDAVRRQADALFGRDALRQASRTPRGHVPFTPDAKKALELALREAVRLKQRSIYSTHLLLGILRSDNVARELLLEAGADTEALRTALEHHTRAA